jgi:CyaY protein
MTDASDHADQDQLFRRRADDLLTGLLQSLDTFDPDELEAEASAGVIKMTFADGSRCVLNRQSAANQIWLAEGATAWHFVWDDAAAAWTDTKGRGPLRRVLAEVISRRLGRPIEF